MSMSIFGAKLIHLPSSVFTERKTLNKETHEEFLDLLFEMFSSKELKADRIEENGIWLANSDFWIQFFVDDKGVVCLEIGVPAA